MPSSSNRRAIFNSKASPRQCRHTACVKCEGRWFRYEPGVCSTPRPCRAGERCVFLVNTRLQPGGAERQSDESVSTVFPRAAETVETVAFASADRKSVV